ncbi:leucine-rich repeat protein kinase family protein [Actinidia rufa]|uniref:non-specific serine/threonine protein kinase n=1 Tax=Actinidia rufa TaxID=165716 RepID=A0A7J0DZ29_9ERIC|nr:leucine-rich repeat protein kinase family protein [Actinidia rufa]
MAPYNLPQSLVLIGLLLHVTASYSKPESEILLGFKASLANNDALLSWNSSTTPCSGDKENWVGVLCDNGNVWGLKLENMGLSGVIDVEVIKELPGLRTISLMNNNFDGSIPSLKKLGALKSVYLSNNKFSGEIESNAFDGMQSLKKIHLANNQFKGLIPLSLTILPKLIEVSLAGNHFNGEIPDFKIGILKSINVSNNELEGQIPQSLSKMSMYSFSGNGNLCGAPLTSCSSSTSKKLPVVMIAVLAVSVLAALAAILAVVILLRRRHHTPLSVEARPTVRGHKKAASADLDREEQGSSVHSTTSKKGENNSGKLTFLRDTAERFDLGDLLKASAEVLGSGYFGSSYKAALVTGKMMVVKRFRHMNNVGREEFQEHMRRLGRLGHTNLLPLVAFYYRKEEKLLVSEYVNNVSLAVHLHGNRSRGHPSPDWPTRLKIIKGVAKGLQYLYNELPSLIIPHGHLKSSNVLLNESFEPLLTDYGLVPVVNQEHAQEVMVAYKSPEHKQNGRVTKKTDVWSFGILILETLTGKFPTNYLQQGKGSDTDLVTWVNSMVREGSTGEVFDKDMGATKNSEGEMMKLLKIGMACAEVDVEKRCDLKEAIEKIEEVKEKDNDEEFYSSYTSEGDVKSSRGLSDDFSYSLS